MYAVLSGTNTAPKRKHARYSAIGFGRLLDLRDDSIARDYRALRERRGDTIDEPGHRAIAHALSVGGLQEQPIGIALCELIEPGGGIGVGRGVR